MHPTLQRLYDASASELRFAIGLMDLPGRGRVPLVQVYYADWGNDMLAAVRPTFAAGLALAVCPAASGTADLRISTRQQVTLQLQQAGETHTLQAPGWDATLAGITPPC